MEIPSTVTSIGDAAFYGCDGLTSIEIPSSVTSIGARAFSGCEGLTSIEIPSSVTDINDSTFIWCSNLTSVEIPSSVKRIGDAAFYECYSLTSIEIPSSVTSIGARAFTDSKLVYVTLPASVVRLGEGAFYGCSDLLSVDLSSSLEILEDNLFSGCYQLKRVKIPSTVTRIGNGTFSRCSCLTSMEIPSSVKSIGSSAFSGCSGLTTVTFAAPCTLESIGDYGFLDCSGLGQLALPSSLCSLGEAAFYGCSGLGMVVLPASFIDDNWDASRIFDVGTWFALVVLSQTENLSSQQLSCLTGYLELMTPGAICFGFPGVLNKVDGLDTENLLVVGGTKSTDGRVSFIVNEAAYMVSVLSMELDGRIVEADENGRYTFENVPDAEEYEVTVYTDILGTEYPLHFTVVPVEETISVAGVESTAGDWQPEVCGNLAENRAWVRVPGEGGAADWTLTTLDGTTVAKGRTQADGSWHLLDGAQGAKGLCLLSVRCGLVVKTVKFMAR